MLKTGVTIIGAGPGGIATAIQLKRWGLEPLLLERDHIGGLLINANRVENYPGFPSGISGRELARLFESQMERIGVVTTFDEVKALDWDDGFHIQTDQTDIYSKIVVIASGTMPRIWDAFAISDDLRNKVLYEVYPIAEVRDRRILIIGGGDAAFDYALGLSNYNQITILNRGDKRKCLPLLWERASQSPSIDYQENALLTAIEEAPNGLNCRGNGQNGDWELTVDYVIFAIGRTPQQGFVSDQMKDKLTLLEDEGVLYLVGDVKNDIYRQASIAVGNGIQSAMRICRKIEGID